MRAVTYARRLALLAILCTGCHHNTSATRAGAGAPFADRKRNAEPTRDHAAAGEDRPAAGFALAAALRAERAAAAPAAAKEGASKVKPPPAKPADTAQTPAATAPGGTTAAA